MRWRTSRPGGRAARRAVRKVRAPQGRVVGNTDPGGGRDTAGWHPVIISGGVDGTVRVWRTADGTPIGEPL